MLVLCFACFACLAFASDINDVAALEGALASDDVCAESNSEGECSLELRLLRAKELKMRAERAAGTDDAAQGATDGTDNGAADGTADGGDEEQQAVNEAQESLETEGASSFGPDAIGVDMWTEATWGDIVDMLQSNASVEGQEDYYPGYGPHDGYGSYGGHPAYGYGNGYAHGYGHHGHHGHHGHSFCEASTGGTCGVFSCSKSRGATKCIGGHCVCAHGFCAKAGFCYPMSSQSCMADTGGTCSVTSCRNSRGKTKCKHGRCLCKTGGCAWKGKCFPVTDTGGTCSLMGCSSSRGHTTCHRGRCLCRAGFVAVHGRCERYF